MYFVVFFRWKRDPNGHIINNLGTTKPILQFICIQRSDSGEWAIPGVRHGKIGRGSD